MCGKDKISHGVSNVLSSILVFDSNRHGGTSASMPFFSGKDTLVIQIGAKMQFAGPSSFVDESSPI